MMEVALPQYEPPFAMALGFLIFWLWNMYVAVRGSNAIRALEAWAGPIRIGAGLARRAGGPGGGARAVPGGGRARPARGGGRGGWRVRAGTGPAEPVRHDERVSR